MCKCDRNPGTFVTVDVQGWDMGARPVGMRTLQWVTRLEEGANLNPNS